MFLSFNGVPRSRIARLRPDGLLDPSFIPPALALNVLSLVVQTDGAVLVGGNSPSGTPVQQPVRLSAEGAMDSLFDSGLGVQITPSNFYYPANRPTVSALALQPDGRVLVGGIFNQYNGTPRIGLARLTQTLSASTAVSRKIHGTAGVFDLPLAGTPVVEPRSGGGAGEHQIVFNFGGPITFQSAFLDKGMGQVAGISGFGTEQVIINLSGVANAQRIRLTLTGVTNGAQSMDVSAPLGVLLGDTTGNGSVTATDVSQTKLQSGQPVSPSNFRTDVNASGSVNATDLGQVKAQAGTALP